MKTRFSKTFSAALVLLTGSAWSAELPNVLVIMGDDIGWTNISAYGHGIVGYDTPNIDRLANEGMKFTDYYGEQSCTAGRSAFITGQSPLRTGLTKVGVPGSEIGIQDEDPTLGDLLRPLGYATGQFGKNHLGDQDKYLPTNHGFDEFFGNLYHLNAEEEPEHEDYPTDPKFRQRFGPRGVIRSYADGRIEDTGPLTRKRMETVDEEFLEGALDFMERAVKNDKPFFTWFNSTRMHYYTHVKPESRGISGQNFYGDGMVEHDGHVGQLLDKLDELGVTENTIVIYTTDNGPHYNQWPDAAIAPFRGEKNTNWEGGFRVPAIVRWPGKVKGGTTSHEIMSHLDWVPTIMTAAGVPSIGNKLRVGHQAGDKKFRVYLDGHDFHPYLTGAVDKGPRTEFHYLSDDGLLMGMRWNDWKFVFAEQHSQRFDVWRDPFKVLRIPKIFNLRQDPFERADTDSNMYNVWWDERTYLLFNAQDSIRKFVFTFQAFPQRQRPASFTVDQILEVLESFAPDN